MTAVLEDEVLAEQGEETSLLSGCRTLMRAITKVLIKSSGSLNKAYFDINITSSYVNLDRYVAVL